MKLLLCLSVTLVFSFYSFGQNNNTSSNKPTNKTTRRKVTKKKNATDLDLSGIDLSGIDELLRDMKEWPHVGNTSYSSVSYGAKTIRRLNGNIVRVWTKTTLKDETDETKSEFLRNRKVQGLRTSGYEKYSHTLELDEYSCSKGEGRVLSQLDYDESGNVIDSTTYKNPGWDYIVPNSIGESLFRAVCKQTK